MGWKTQNNKDVNFIQIDMYYKIPIKISDILFCKYREDYFEIYMKKQKN